MIGVLFDLIESSDVIENSYAAGILQGIVREARSAHYDVLIYTEPRASDGVPGTDFRDQRTDGVILVAPLIGSTLLERVAEAGLPTCVISSNTALSQTVSRVDTDHAGGVRSIVRHLLELGHRRIAHVPGKENGSSTIRRCEAFKAALAEAGLPLPAGYLTPSPYDGFPVQVSLRALMALPEPPTAIFAFSDDIALGILRAARRLRVPVPRRLSIVGFDDIPVVSDVVPPLTTVRQPLKEIGAASVRRLLGHIDGERVTVEESLPTTLIVRRSTAPPL